MTLVNKGFVIPTSMMVEEVGNPENEEMDICCIPDEGENDVLP